MRSSKNKIFVVVNPEAGGGVARRLWPEVSHALQKAGLDFDSEETEAPGHGKTLAADAAQAGYGTVVACGGDGTIHEVVNGIEKAGTTLGIISMGTGGDLIRTLGFPKGWQAQVEVLARRKTRRIDLGTIECTIRHAGRKAREKRVFINETDIGIGVDVVQRIRKTVHVFGKKLAYVAATLQSFALWHPVPVTIRADDDQSIRCLPVSVVVANGRYYGGGIPVAPRADPFDGLLDLVVMRKMNPLLTAVASPFLYAGKHLRLPNVTHDRVREVHLESSSEDVGVDIDGEPVGFLPATIGIRPKALAVIVP